jgi:hypothetical protein
MSKGWIMGLIQDMKDSPTAFPTANGGNHPLWVLGHLTYSEGNLVNEFVLGKTNPVAQWKEIFGQGSEPVADLSRYPSFDEVLGKFEEIRSNTLQALDTLSDDDLDKPSRAPADLSQFFGNVGQCFAAIPMHFTYHGGQVADARRSAGKKPLMG